MELAPEIAEFLTRAEAMVLSRLRSPKPEEFLGNLSLLGQMKHLLERFGGHVEQYHPSIDFEELESRTLQWYTHASRLQRRSVRATVREWARKHMKAVRQAVALFEEAKLPSHLSDSEFDHDIFYLRESLEFAHPYLTRLALGPNVERIFIRMKVVDRLLKELAQEAVPLYSRSQGYQPRNPDLAPTTFWWRKAAFGATRATSTARDSPI